MRKTIYLPRYTTMDRDPSTNLMLCWGKKGFRQILGGAGRHHIPCGYVRDYSGPLPEVVRPLHLGERSAPHWSPFRPCHHAAGLGHPTAHPPWSARPVEVPAGILRPRYKSQTLLVPTAQARRQEAESPTEYFNRLRWKNPLQPESDRTSLQQCDHRLLCPTRSGHQKAHEERQPPPQNGSLIQEVPRPLAGSSWGFTTKTLVTTYKAHCVPHP